MNQMEASLLPRIDDLKLLSAAVDSEFDTSSRISGPEWRIILQESIERPNRKREEYARWMLRDVLLDPEYGKEIPWAPVV